MPIDEEAIAALAQSDYIHEHIGPGRMLSVWLRQTERGAKQVYDVRVVDEQPGGCWMLLARRGAFLPTRAFALVRKFRRQWSRLDQSSDV